MLTELRIQNLAVIEQLTLRLEPGLNALTGETGTGKSIIVGALSLLLGERASSEDVRPGSARAVVEGVFEIAQRPEITALLEAQGVDSSDGLLILRREVAAEGRNRAWVNGAAATAGMVGELGRALVDLHGQHEHQALLRPDEQRRVLDAYCASSGLAAEVRSAWESTRDAGRRLEQLEQRGREAAQRADYLQFQVKEIERAAVRPGEDEELARESRRLEHADELARGSEQLYQELHAAETSITARLDDIRRKLQQLARLDPVLDAAAKSLEDGFYLLEEIGRELGEFSRAVEHDPNRLEEVRRRRDLLYRLQSRYGPTLEDVLATLRGTQAELATLDNLDAERAALQGDLAAARERLIELARSLSAARRAGAERLSRELALLLPELGMGGPFEVALTPLPEPGGNGAEEVEFLVAANQGFEPRPLARVASGGELSRLMLALKAVVARVETVPTLVFDEIDVGIGGRVAHQVGTSLRSVAERHQVFVITHLAQIAARADHHLLVEKQQRDGSTCATVTELAREARVQELARLLGGDPESTSSIRHARQLLHESAPPR